MDKKDVFLPRPINTVAKTFAKIAKTFAGLSTTIIATRRRPVLILHLEAKYAKMD